MAYTKKEKTSYISKYDNHKVLKRFNKPKSPKTIMFCTKDFPDEWLVDYLEFKTKSGIVTYDVFITASQLPKYYEDLLKEGFIETKV